MIAFGILQGRLSPAPQGRPQAFPLAWRDEFAHARRLGFTAIEWLVTGDRVLDNPLLTDRGVAEIREVAQESGVPVASVCADCFIALPLVNASQQDQRERIGALERIVGQAARAGAAVVVLPLLEANAPATDDDAISLLKTIAPAAHLAARAGVRIALETPWNGERVRRILAAAGVPSLGVCYDIGNAAALGHQTATDVRVLGSLIAAVHVKDRRRAGESTPLGDGEADLAGTFAALDEIGFGAPAIFETPAGIDPIGNASRNLAAARRLAAKGMAAAR